MIKIIFAFTYIIFLTSCGVKEYVNKTKAIQEEADKKSTEAMVQFLDTLAEDEDIPTLKIVAYGEKADFIEESDSDLEIHVRITDVAWKGKNISTSEGDYTATNQFLVITLESENVGKKPNSVYLWGAKLITPDDTEYNPNELMELENLDEGFGGCMSCEHNPGQKNREALLFDILDIDLTGAKLKFEVDGYEFLLQTQ